MESSEYDIGFFLSDPAFVDWVKNPAETKNYHWQRWLEQHPEARDSFYEARAIILGVDYRSSDRIGARKEEILRNVLGEKPVLHRKKQRLRTTSLYPVIFRGAAAVLILFLLATFMYKTGQLSDAEKQPAETALVTKFSPKGQKMSFYLPDNSRVILNAGSALRYPVKFSSGKRVVYLEGEAYFDVQHDSVKQFIVSSGEINTTVHGTAFNVRAYRGEEMSIALERGSVSVETVSDDTTSFFLSPGEKLRVSDNFRLSGKSHFDFEEELGWKEGILVFRDAGMDEFVRRIERWYDVNITVKNLEGRSLEVTGSFKNQSLKTVLESLEFTSGVAYRVQGREVVIYPDNKNGNSIRTN